MASSRNNYHGSKSKKLENSELKFFDSLEAAIKDLDQIDLIFTSGTLQCVPEPYDMLGKIISAKAPLVMFARCCFIQKNTDLIVNHRSMLSWHGKGDMPIGFIDKEVTYPFTFMSLDKFIREVSKSYELILKLDDTSGVFPVDDEPVFGLGLLFQLKK